jgi:hypothetical protein
MSYHLETALLLTVLVMPLVAALSRFRWLDSASKVLVGLVVVAFVTEVIATYSSLTKRSNILTYIISGFVQLLLVCLYLELSIGGWIRRYHIGTGIGLAASAYSIYSMLYLQGGDAINTNFQVIGQTTVILLGIVQLVRLVGSNWGWNIWNNPHFSFGIILISSSCCLLFYLLSYQTFSSLLHGNTKWLDLGLLYTNILGYLFISLIFFRYPKMIRSNGH